MSALCHELTLAADLSVNGSTQATCIEHAGARTHPAPGALARQLILHELL
jgi:hypothetical protein